MPFEKQAPLSNIVYSSFLEYYFKNDPNDSH